MRYDGGHKHQPDLLERLAAVADWDPVCPETEAGMPTPRPPINVHRDAGEIRLLQVDDGRDMTKPLQDWAEHSGLARIRSRQICGLILKARSPSCGAGTTPVYDAEGRLAGMGNGLFVELVRQQMPWLPVADEILAKDKNALELFLWQIQLVNSFHHSDKELRRNWLADIAKDLNLESHPYEGDSTKLLAAVINSAAKTNPV